VSPLRLDSPVLEIDPRLANRRIGAKTKGAPAHEVLAESLGIVTVGQLLRHYPRRYIDRSATVDIGQLRLGQEATVIGNVASVSSRRTRRGQSMVTVRVYDGTGFVELLYFNQPWMGTRYRQGSELAVSGQVKSRRGGTVQLGAFEVEELSGDDADQVHTGRITPVHPATEGVSTKTIRELVFRALERLPRIPEPIPPDIVEAEHLASEDEALRGIHFPEDEAARRRAVDRLKFDELFTLELGVAFRKQRVESSQTGVAHRAEGDLTRRFLEGLPFALTAAQQRAVKEVGEDMAAPRPMNRLLQGDVGSGKTVVALHAAMAAIQSGHQATIMAPTEVLAGQHFRTAAALLGAIGAVDALAVPLGSNAAQASLLEPASEPAPTDGPIYALLTAAVTGKDRQRVLEGVREGSIDLVIGTHALVQEGVEFAELSLAVIDEQHRFGVHQRIRLKEKGAHPDVLIMTATPIPRTLALTYYGDLDVSVLDEMPPGRQPVQTTVVRSPVERRQAYGLVREQVAAGRQAFVVCAAIDQGHPLDLKAAEAEADRLRTEVFPNLGDRIRTLHGRMRPREKDEVMEEFRRGNAPLLISTTVIEVGVDVPNATVMLVENAERFGLAQLHQLRGRVGRGAAESFCILFDEADSRNEQARQRLDAMARTNDGFVLAEEDLRLRGSGSLLDIRQSGMPDLRLARVPDDEELIKRARARAFELVVRDPGLERHPGLLDLLRETFAGEAIAWLFHS